MKKKILLIAVLSWSCLLVSAQQKIELYPHKPHRVEVLLRDNFKTEDNFLMNLPLTLSLTDKNILMVMIGNDTILDYKYSVWFFSEEFDFAELLKKDRNVSGSRMFKSQNRVLNKALLYHDKMRLYRPFDDGYEFVKKNAKPVLFEILNLPADKSLKISLQFYVAKPEKQCPYYFIAKCNPVEFEIIIKQ